MDVKKQRLRHQQWPFSCNSKFCKSFWQKHHKQSISKAFSITFYSFAKTQNTLITKSFSTDHSSEYNQLGGQVSICKFGGFNKCIQCSKYYCRQEEGMRAKKTGFLFLKSSLGSSLITIIKYPDKINLREKIYLGSQLNCLLHHRSHGSRSLGQLATL